MHNRARLVVGSFLTKDLGIDWRWGERWFMRLLIDGDEANNNGNWQWIASVGTDPQPAFRRIYNPARHQERYDPDNAYVRRYVPELRAVPDQYMREPWTMPEEIQREAGCVIGDGLPGADRRPSTGARGGAGAIPGRLERVGTGSGMRGPEIDALARSEVIDSEPASDMAETAVVEVQMPQMGESVTEGTILEWHVSEGQEVAEGDTVVEVSTDKIDAEVPAPATGVVTKILAQPDDTVEVGQVLAQIDPERHRLRQRSADPSPLKESDGLVMGGGEGDEDLGDDDVAGRVPAARPSRDADPDRYRANPRLTRPPPEAKPRRWAERWLSPMPEMGESVTEGTVLEWHVEEGQQVSEGDTVVEVSTDKVDAEVPAPASGTITKLLAAPDDTVQVGQALAEMSAGETADRTPADRRAERPAEAPPDRRGRRRRPRLARRPSRRRRQGRRHRPVKGSGPAAR